MSSPTPTLMRKLGAAEIVYDYELRLKNMILPITLVFESQGVDLFQHRPKIDAAILKWKSIHSLLGARIVALPDPNHTFSNERYFAQANQDKQSSLYNVSYLRLVVDEETPNLAKYVDILNERESNIDTIDSENGLLWRLSIIELSGRNYAFLFTSHHSIIDAKNGFHLLEHLLELVDLSIDGQLEQFEFPKLELNPSIEEKLFGNEPSKLTTIKTNEKFQISPETKLPPEFGRPSENGSKRRELTDPAARFEYLPDENNNRNLSLFVRDLDQSSSAFKYTSFILDESILNQLLSKCKQLGSKLTGCLNVIASLAMARLLRLNKFDSLSQKICYHLLANLRPFFNLGDLNIGYWAVVMNCVVGCEGVDIESGDEFKNEFWRLAKTESDSIHERIKEGELFESAKEDAVLLDMINKEVKFENGGGVHFALSNLGALQFKKLKRLHPREFYFCTSLVKDRWSALIFNGICSIDGRLCWSIGYVAESISDNIIDEYINSIHFITKTVLN